jgi:hypothetical protein
VGPDRRLLCAVGDNPMVMLLDARTGAGMTRVGRTHARVVADRLTAPCRMCVCAEALRLAGHLDNGFGCAWSPDGRCIATSNEDYTARSGLTYPRRRTVLPAL